MPGSLGRDQGTQRGDVVGQIFEGCGHAPQ
jgi:hypothetical protein